MENKDRTAFPTEHQSHDGSRIIDFTTMGLSKREYFAIKIYSNLIVKYGDRDITIGKAVELTDKLLVELDK